ncbi:hypothetical protein [Nocardia brasiliensis]|uniref:hypothetical protein n=1 Tax=Nocardia brasiliensis TaxID=37326 RepID=UPI00142E2F8F|nr:hypothetical protein [Nocardia brasiliensis]
MPRIVGRQDEGALVVAAGGVCVVVEPEDRDADGRCTTAPEALLVRPVRSASAASGFVAADEPMPDGLLSAEQIDALLNWEAGYVDGVADAPDRPGLSGIEADRYLRDRPDTGDVYRGTAGPVDRPFSLEPRSSGAEDDSDGAATELDIEPDLLVQLCASMAQVEDLSGAQIVADAATDLIDRISYVATVGEFYPVLAAAVAAETVPDLAVELTDGFNAQEVLDFLRRLVAELDDRRPWPEPALTPVDPRTWPSQGASVPIGWLDLTITDLEWAVKAGFADVPVGEHPLLVLRMRDGQLVALVGDAQPNPVRFLVLVPDTAAQPDPAEVRDYLARYAGLRVETEDLAAALVEVGQA